MNIHLKKPHFLLGILFAGILFVIPVKAQDTEIHRLQQKVADLEARIKELESLLNESILIPKKSTPGWHNKKNWRKLTRGMSQTQVNALLGEPIKIIQGKKILWYYPNLYGGIVAFDENGNVVNWNEP